MFVLYENDEEDDKKNLKKKRVKIATKHALIAYVIAIFIHIDSIILAPFLLHQPTFKMKQGVLNRNFK